VKDKGLVGGQRGSCIAPRRERRFTSAVEGLLPDDPARGGGKKNWKERGEPCSPELISIGKGKIKSTYTPDPVCVGGRGGGSNKGERVGGGAKAY